MCLAIENLWLACTAEGWGIGWVSFYEENFLSQLLGIPEPVRPVAWLCIGPVSRLADVPDLERHGWRERLPLEEVLHTETWKGVTVGAEFMTGTTPIGAGSVEPSGIRTGIGAKRGTGPVIIEDSKSALGGLMHMTVPDTADTLSSPEDRPSLHRRSLWRSTSGGRA